jgi:hypothetical protein
MKMFFKPKSLIFSMVYSQVSDLCTKYCLSVDNRDIDGLVQLYTRDGVFDSVGGQVGGQMALKSYYEDRLKMYGPTFHYVHGIAITSIERGSITATVSSHAEIGVAAQTQIVAMRYNDTYEKGRNGLLFKQRIVNILYSVPQREVTTILAEDKRIRWPGTVLNESDFPEQLASWQNFYK